MPKRDMLINNVPGEECRIAIVEDGKLEELYHERTSVESHVGSIYKGKVVNVEPAIQAAFIDFGLERNGFLHVTDLHPRYFPGQHKEETERVGHKTPHRERPPIQRCLKRGQEILVQVIKEGIGTKGPTVTSYLSIPGRFLVMMPAMERLGVSRKVDDDEARREMRKILDELNPPDEFGFIIRTAGMGRPKSDLKRDLAYLVRLWKNLEKRMEQPGVGELYTESDLMIRTIRDVYSTDIDRIIVDESTAAKRAADFLAIASPRAKSNVLYYDDPVPLFHRYGVEAQIETIHARRVPLPGGGSLVIDSTEALVAIDVNSGKMRNSGDAETTAYRTNVEACDEVCRQLRLRDLGGVVVIDLIDMRSAQKRRAIEARFRENLKKDRARTKPLAISQFGILEMTRQRMRPALTKSVYSDCHYCHGEGTIKNVDAVVLDVMRRLSLVISRKEVAKLAVTVSPDVAFPLLNRKRGELVRLEEKFHVPIQVRVNPSGSVDFIELLPMDERGNPLTIDAMKNLTAPTLHPVESGGALIEDDYVDEEVVVAELEERATVVEDIDDHIDEHQVDGDDRDMRSDSVDRERSESIDRADSVDREPDEEFEPGSEAPASVRGDNRASDDESDDRRADESDDREPAGAAASAASGDQSAPAEGQPGEGGNRRRRRRRGRRGRGGNDGQDQPGPQGQQGKRDGHGQPRPQQIQPQRHPQQGQQRPPQGQPPRQPQGQHARPPQGERQGGGYQQGGRSFDEPPVSRGYSGGRVNQPIADVPEPGNRREPEPGNEAEGHVRQAGGQRHPQPGKQQPGNPPRVNPQAAGQQGGSQQDGNQPPQLGPDGQPLRRRRRRGGRRHRRRREAQLRAQQTGGPGVPPTNGDGNIPDDIGNRAFDEQGAPVENAFDRGDAEDRFDRPDGTDESGFSQQDEADQDRFDQRDEADTHRDEHGGPAEPFDREEAQRQPYDEAPTDADDRSGDRDEAPQREPVSVIEDEAPQANDAEPAEAPAESAADSGEKKKPSRTRRSPRKKITTESLVKKKTTRRTPRRKPPGSRE